VATDKMPTDVRPRQGMIQDDTEDMLLSVKPLYPAKGAGSPGIIMLTPSLRLLHMNPQACELSRRMKGCDEKVAHGILPLQILQLCAAVRRYGSFEGISTSGDQSIVLYGFKIPDDDGQPAKILILMTKALEQDWPPIGHAVERFGLTQREETVVRQLALGYTNKEIANALCIAEQTVKEHIKHLMIKTGARTRTGLLARILAAASQKTEVTFPGTMAG
jgi:DNA-binding CsgD family transcriptional regulator